MKEYASEQSRIKVSYIGHQISVTDVSYSGWRLVTLIFKYLTPVTVTVRQSLYETSAIVQDSNTLHQSWLRDISHCTRFQPLHKTSNTISVTGHWRILSNVYSYALTAEPVAIGSSKDGTVRNDLRMTEENYQTYDNYIKIYIK